MFICFCCERFIVGLCARGSVLFRRSEFLRIPLATFRSYKEWLGTLVSICCRCCWTFFSTLFFCLDYSFSFFRLFLTSLILSIVTLWHRTPCHCWWWCVCMCVCFCTCLFTIYALQDQTFLSCIFLGFGQLFAPVQNVPSFVCSPHSFFKRFSSEATEVRRKNNTTTNLVSHS